MSVAEKTDVSVRPLLREDRPAVIELLRTAMGEARVRKTEEFWRWKHELNPFGPSPGVVAVAEGRIVGVRVFMRWELRRGSERLSTVRAVDTATHPDWQGRGVFSRLTKALLEQMKREGVAFVFNTPNKSSLPGYLKMGWHDLGRLDVWVHPSPRGLVGSLLRRFVTRAEGEVPSGLRPLASLLEEASLPAFLEGIATRRGIHTPITIEHLRWRYADVPGFSYFSAWEEGALVIGRLNTRGWSREALLAVVAATPGPSGALGLRRALQRWAAAGCADHLVAGLPSGPTEATGLALAGFLPAPRVGLRLTARPLAGAVPARLRREWRSAVSDLELL